MQLEKFQKDLKGRVKKAVSIFLNGILNDKELLCMGAHEQAISHRIAVYLEPLFKGYHIDCEYNKHGDQKGNKKIIKNAILNARKNCECRNCKRWSKRNNNVKYILIRPDIIIHKERGNENSGNIIAIEIKKDKECFFDQEKLKELTKKDGNFKYELGVFIYFQDNKPKYKCFVDGEKYKC